MSTFNHIESDRQTPFLLNILENFSFDQKITDKLFVMSSRVYKHSLYVWSRLGDLVRCILSFNFGVQQLYI